MINSVEILINRGFIKETKAIIDYHKNIYYLNNKLYKVDDVFLNKLKEILYIFKSEYGIRAGIDIEEFTITVYDNGRKNKYYEKGIFPTYYRKLKKY